MALIGDDVMLDLSYERDYVVAGFGIHLVRYTSQLWDAWGLLTPCVY